MADRDLQNILNSGSLTNIYLGGVASSDKVVTQAELDNIITQLASKDSIHSMTSFYIPTLRAEQTLVTDTWTKLDWSPEDVGEPAVSPIIAYGTDDIEYDNVGFQILIKTTGFYRLAGSANIDATINDVFTLGTMLDTPSTLEPQFQSIGIGRNTSTNPAPVLVDFTRVIPLTAGENITKWAKTSGTKIQVHSLTYTIEKLPY